MTLQFLLAFGIMYAAMGIAMVANPTQIKKAFVSLFKNDGLLFFFGFLSLMFGVVILTLHKTFASPLEMLVTIFGILGILKGIIYMAYPHALEKRVLAKFKNEKNIRAIGTLCIAIAGLFLWKTLWCGCLG